MHHLPSRVRVVAALAAILVVSQPGHAGVPPGQVIPLAQWDAVVRVNDSGTGTVIEKKPVRDAQQVIIAYDLCVLTCDHVVKGVQQNFIRFKNIQAPIDSPAFNADQVFRGGLKALPVRPNGPMLPAGKVQNPDLAVLGVHVVLDNDNRAFFNNLVTFALAPAYGLNPDGTNNLAAFPRLFSCVGYGISGIVGDFNLDTVNDGYDNSLGYGVRRYSNNLLTFVPGLPMFQSEPPPPDLPTDMPIPVWETASKTPSLEDGVELNNFKYTYEAWVWTLDRPGAPAAVAGEGIAWSGDSGAPYLCDGPVIVGGIPVSAGLIIGVHTAGTALRLPNNTLVKTWGSPGYGQSSANGVRLVPSYLLWIQQSCAQIPPPPCQGDANGDGNVNAADLSVLLASFGLAVPPGTGADFNGDGFVNLFDLSVLLGNFGCTS